MSIEHQKQATHEYSEEHYERILSTLGARGLIDASQQHEKNVLVSGKSYTLIGPYTRLDKGAPVDVGSKSAIIIDFDNDKVLDDTYRRVLPALERVSASNTRQEGLTALTSVIANRLLTYDAAAVVDLYRTDFSDTRPLVPHTLGEFIQNGTGICIQQALLVSALLEHAKDEELLPDTSLVSLESSHYKERGEVHAFTLFRIDDEGWRLDPTQSRAHRAELV